MGGIGSTGVDVKPDFIFVEAEPDHSSTREKIVGLTHGKHRLAPQALEDSGLAQTFVVAEEEDVAALGGLHLAQQANMQCAGSDRFVLQKAQQFLEARLVIEDAQGDDLIRALYPSAIPILRVSLRS